VGNARKGLSSCLSRRCRRARAIDSRVREAFRNRVADDFIKEPSHMGQLDALIPLQVEEEWEANTFPTWGLSAAAGAFANVARAGKMTDIQAFAESARWAIRGRLGENVIAADRSEGAVVYGNPYTRIVLNDLRRVLIGDGWTSHERNHGEFALHFNAFLDTGFKPEFPDGGNQVQHAMAGIYIRCVHGWLASKVPYLMEDEDADLALYREAFEIGDMLAFLRPIEDLPDLIIHRLGAY
jgi:hypothetical protein